MKRKAAITLFLGILLSKGFLLADEEKGLSFNGSLSIEPSYTWIEGAENATSLYEGWKNKINIFTMARTPNIGIVPFRPKTAIKSGNSLAEDTIRPLWF